MRPTHGSAPVGDGVLDVPPIRTRPTASHSPRRGGACPSRGYAPNPRQRTRRGRRPRRPVVRPAPRQTRPPVGEGLAPPKKNGCPYSRTRSPKLSGNHLLIPPGRRGRRPLRRGRRFPQRRYPCARQAKGRFTNLPPHTGWVSDSGPFGNGPYDVYLTKKANPQDTGSPFLKSVLIIRGGGCAGDHRSSSSPRGMSPASRSPSSSASSPRSSSSISPQAGHWMEPRASVSSPKLISSPQEGQVTS